ncbi:hypothetical protein [Thiomonas intermedia]|uniref:hypothetical protein n=1 Tax=Thiomonas intermedia TaxID=926 RepID=UPI001FE8C496|nr:hypothetical protein [Thiomonas intermedia]
MLRMFSVLRPVLILLLVLLPLRGWAQANMTVADCHEPVATAERVQAPQHDDSMSMDACHTPTDGECTGSGHLHCVICQLAVGQPATFVLRLTQAVPHACPLATHLAWHDADPHLLQRPPRA